jgi:hypothetical protein
MIQIAHFKCNTEQRLLCSLSLQTCPYSINFPSFHCANACCLLEAVYGFYVLDLDRFLGGFDSHATFFVHADRFAGLERWCGFRNEDAGQLGISG